MKANAAKRLLKKRLLRKRRAIALERRNQRLKLAINRAALFTVAAVAVMMALQLFDSPTPPSTSSAPLQQPIVRHYAFVLSLIGVGFFGTVFVFLFFSHPQTLSTWRLMSLGALFAVVAYGSFLPAISFAGVLGAILWLFLLALGIVFTGAGLRSGLTR